MDRYLLLFLSLFTFVSISYADQIYVASNTPAPNNHATSPNSPNNNFNNLSYNDNLKNKWMESCTKSSGSNSIMLSQKFCECGWDKITAQIPVQSWLNQSPQNLAQMNVQLKVILQECQVAVQTVS